MCEPVATAIRGLAADGNDQFSLLPRRRDDGSGHRHCGPPGHPLRPRTEASRYPPRRRRPAKLHADKGYDYDHLRRWLRTRRIVPHIARKRIESSRRPATPPLDGGANGGVAGKARDRTGG